MADEVVAPVVEEVVAPVVEGEPIVEDVLTLPSDEVEFTMPDKFAGKTAEEIAQSYIELEKFKGGEPAPAVVETPVEGEATPTEADPHKAYIDEFLGAGELSEESYKALEDEGNTREQINDRMEFEAYKSKKGVDELVEVIGGIDNFTQMDEWAKEAFTPEVMSEYSQELAGASKFAKQAILKDIYGQYNASLNGEAPTSDAIHTNEPQAKVSRGYTSQHELQADMSDRRYGVDRSYTNAVEAKLAKSKGF